MTHFHDTDDMKYLPELRKAAPDEFKAWVAFDAIVAREDGAIPRKYRELIAIASATVTQCVYCLNAHTAAAKKAGATREEVAEAGLLAAALRAGAGGTHATLALKMFDEVPD
ncbi:carboxymuconolactone decarboxylase family protein [Gordonia hydrophobica]|uniref:Carboxymuconolactone decarboxylase family protein n=1 Tax=Gordonia hydrophobica TaxID=40516 RepID=A0ABZ2U664_9ACTN|nr:carboxymuconolactone decarboxylase family protein [Gordonia hydrophobica]MBM7365533.1 AhpD family alkylhydroperoxidase [Gordonia hydrophobica]